MEAKVDRVIAELCSAVEVLMDRSSALAGRVAELRKRLDAGQETRPAVQQMARLADEAERYRRALDTSHTEDLLLDLRRVLADELNLLGRLAERRRIGLHAAPSPKEPATVRTAAVRPRSARARVR